MVNIKGTRLYFLILGILEVLLSLVFVISTKIVLEKYSNGTEWYSLFYLYYAIPGILCILSGVRTSQKIYIRASIVFHIISVVVSTIGAAVSSVFWQMYNEDDACQDETGKCICFKESYSISCKDGKVSRVLLAILTSAHIFMIMASFVGSVLACTNVCCDPMSSTENRSSRMDNSHSEQTAVSSIHGSQHESTTICQTSMELKTYKESASPSIKLELNNEQNQV